MLGAETAMVLPIYLTRKWCLPSFLPSFLRRFGLTRQQVVYGLERVELRSTDLFRRCPTAGGIGGGGGRTPRQRNSNNRNNLENFIQIPPQGEDTLHAEPSLSRERSS